MKQGKLGVLGGMGPQATLTFYQRVLDVTDAASDQAHLPTLILSDTAMPDRTAALLSGNEQPVRERLLADCRTLEDWGATAIAITCNTSHAFLPAILPQLKVPVVNMITETAAALQKLGDKKAVLLATDGTVQSGLYHRACKSVGIQLVHPDPATQRQVMSLIYDYVKAGNMGDGSIFAPIDAFARSQGVDRAILACTELSVYRDWAKLSDFYLDAMDVLARRSVEVCGYPLRHP